MDEPFARFPVARAASVDEAEEAMRSTFLPLRMRPHQPADSRGFLELGLNATRIADVTVSYVRISHGVDIDTAEAQSYHVNLPIRGGTVSRCGRLEPVTSTPDRAAVFMPGMPATIEWRTDCAQLCVMVPRHVVQRELEAMLDQPLVKSIEFAPAMNVTTDAGRSWLDTLRFIERQTTVAHGLLDHPPAAASLQQLLVHGLLLAQPHNYTDALTTEQRPAAPPTVRRAIEQIRTHPEQPWTTATLARSVAVSARSLQYGFARSIGVPPMQYLRDVRLERIHDDLQAGDPHTTSVSRVAERWGVLDLSRLAAAYRRKFGATPSQTLRGT